MTWIEEPERPAGAEWVPDVLLAVRTLEGMLAGEVPGSVHVALRHQARDLSFGLSVLLLATLGARRDRSEVAAGLATLAAYLEQPGQVPEDLQAVAAELLDHLDARANAELAEIDARWALVRRERDDAPAPDDVEWVDGPEVQDDDAPPEGPANALPPS